jgi:hypothetical protein
MVCGQQYRDLIRFGRTDVLSWMVDAPAKQPHRINCKPLMRGDLRRFNSEADSGGRFLRALASQRPPRTTPTNDAVHTTFFEC